MFRVVSQKERSARCVIGYSTPFDDLDIPEKYQTYKRIYKVMCDETVTDEKELHKEIARGIYDIIQKKRLKRYPRTKRSFLCTWNQMVEICDEIDDMMNTQDDFSCLVEGDKEIREIIERY